MNGRALLAAYLSANKLTHEAFAEKAGVPAPQVSLWLSGAHGRRPGLDNAFRIEEATGGAVPASSWRDLSGKRTKRKASKGRRSAPRRAAARLVRDLREPAGELPQNT